MHLNGMKCEILDLEGAFNVRDLGGYRGADGKTTAKRRFLRAGSLSDLTPQGIFQAEAIGVDCVIDLRSRVETSRHPDKLFGQPGISHFHIPMLDYIQSNITTGDFTSSPKSMAHMDGGLLDNSAASFLEVFRIFADPQYRNILFHCTAGKDRTGVAAMLLLQLAGVSEEDIVEDYSWSETLLGPLKKSEAKESPNVPAYVYSSTPETMLEALGHLREIYGDAKSYLAKAGLSGQEMDRIVEKLLG